MQKRTRNILTPEFQALFLKLLTNGSIRRLGMYSVNDMCTYACKTWQYAAL